MTTIRQETLNNGLQITFVDASNRYFGDYHRVCVEAKIVCVLANLPANTPAEVALRQLAIETFGARFQMDKRLERMGVPTADVDTVRSALIEDYLGHAGSYLGRPGTPRMLIAAALQQRGLSPSHV